MIRVNVTTYYRSRVVWAMHYGEDAPGLIDHWNRDSTDDRIDNLRIATSSQNNANSTIRSDNSSGFKGVSWHKANKKWVAGIRVNGVRTYLGSFTDPEIAHAACVAAAEEHFGKFAHTG
jgi:hypothetical protein